MSKGVLDDWIPWPDLDGKRDDALLAKPSLATAGATNPIEDDNVLLMGLSADSRQICRQMADMGFPLGRVAKVCRALGDDQGQIINYCLLVDKFSEKERFPATAAEHALVLHSVNEANTRKHLKAFVKLAEFGFAAEQIHDALVVCDLKYEKALETLLK